MDFEIKAASLGTELELPYFFYPGYTVVITYQDKEVTLDTAESDNGFLTVVIPENIEEGKITCDYTSTTLEKVAYVISAVSVIGFVVYVIYFRKKCNKEEVHEK